jgi:hypothetical protein
MEQYFLIGSQFTARLKGDRAEQLNKLYHHYTAKGIQFPSKSDLIDELIKAAWEKEFTTTATTVNATETGNTKEPINTEEPGAKELLLKNKIESLETQLATSESEKIKAEKQAEELYNRVIELKEQNSKTSEEPDETKYYLIPKDNEQLKPVFAAYERRKTAGMSKSFAGFILNIFQWTAKNNAHAKQDLIIE